MPAELTIPKSKAVVLFQLAAIAIVVYFSALAALNIYDHVALTASGIWLVFIAVAIRGGIKEDGGLIAYSINRLGEVAGRKFVRVNPDAEGHPCIEFGFQLLGHRFIQHTIPVEHIESVGWSSGQATSLAGRDMKDWHIVLWFDHHNALKSEQRKTWPKPDQEILIIGPSRRKEDTTALGLLVVDFLHAAGAVLVPGKEECAFVRNLPASMHEQVSDGSVLR